MLRDGYIFLFLTAACGVTSLSRPATCQQHDEPDLDFIDSNCDGIDGEISGAIFVSEAVGDDSFSGTMAQPLKTLPAALVLSAMEGHPKDIYLSKGTYDIASASGSARIFGGYDAEKGWARSVDTVTNIIGERELGPDTHLTLQQLSWQSLPSDRSWSHYGESHYVLVVREGASLFVERCRLTSAAGTPGLATDPNDALGEHTAGWFRPTRLR